VIVIQTQIVFGYNSQAPITSVKANGKMVSGL
jgi:hypothetical protein